MNRIAVASLVSASLFAASPALALTNDHGVVVFTQADALAGNVTPGDTPGFPVTISVGGSYRLGSNLVVTTAVNGIEARANEISIDMGGFTLAGSGVGRNGITSFNRSLTVENGTVRGFSLSGIRSIAQFLTVLRMRLVANGTNGVTEATGNPPPDAGIGYATVSFSTISGNGQHGIACTGGCRIENNTVSGNGGNGAVVLEDGAIVLGNNITGNGQLGIYADFYPSEGSGGQLRRYKVGVGNNAVIGNGIGPWQGNIFPMQPNACSPQAC